MYRGIQNSDSMKKFWTNAQKVEQLEFLNRLLKNAMECYTTMPECIFF